MDIKLIFEDLKKDLQSINERAIERLLKEEQVRSSIYCSLKNQGYIVAAERNFEKNSEIECDLVFWKNSGPESWMEIKTARYSNLKGDIRRLDKNGKDSWNNNPRGQAQSWKKDIEKLKKIKNKELPKYFILVEQCHAESIFEILMKDKKSEIKDYFEGMNHEKIMFELKWNKAPVDKCIVRIFDLKKLQLKRTELKNKSF